VLLSEHLEFVAVLLVMSTAAGALPPLLPRARRFFCLISRLSSIHTMLAKTAPHFLPLPYKALTTCILSRGPLFDFFQEKCRLRAMRTTSRFLFFCAMFASVFQGIGRPLPSVNFILSAANEFPGFFFFLRPTASTL